MTAARGIPSTTTGVRTEVYHLALRWCIWLALAVLVPLGIWWYLVLSSFWGLPSARQAAFVIALSLLLTDLSVYLLWQFLVVMRLVITPEGIRYVGVLTNMWSPWSNVAAVDTMSYRGWAYSGLRLKRPALHASRIYDITRIHDPVLRGALFYDPTPFPEDGEPGGGAVATDPAESDPSLPGMPNNFIPLQAFQPNWQSGPLGRAVARYAPAAMGSSLPSTARRGGPLPDSPLRRRIILGLCLLVVALEGFITIRAGTVWAGGTLFSGSPCREVLSCVDAGGTCDTVSGVVVSGSQLWAVSNYADAANVRWTDGRVLRRITLTGNFTVGAISSDARYLAGGDLHGHLDVMDLQSGRAWERRPLHGTIEALGFSGRSQVLALAGEDDVVRFLSARDGRTLGSFHLSRDMSTGAFPSDMAIVETMTFSQDGRLLALTQLSGTFQTWTVGRHPVRNLHFEDIEASNAAFSPDARSVAIGCSDGDVQLRSSEDGSVRQSFSTDEVTSITFSPDGGLVVAGTKPGGVTVWRVRDGAVVHSYNRVATSPIMAVAVATDLRHIVAGSDDGGVELVNS